jgi:uncharacterized protein (DUF488 family)
MDVISVLTVGHSTRPLESFLEILQLNKVNTVADIRSIPRSRRNPQFNKDTLPASLAPLNINYEHISALGGFRHARIDSPNKGWENASFRGFADYMQTKEFEEGLASLIDLTIKNQIAIMCAEVLPWRCHRWLIADALVIRGMTVEHIISLTSRRPHTLTTFASVTGSHILYPAQP